MAGVNLVILVGGVTQDVETRYTANGDCVCNFNLATSEEWTKDGEKQSKTEYHKLVAWRRLGEICGEYLKVGSQIYIEGKLQTRRWEDKNGNARYTTEIVVQKMQMLGGKKDTPNVAVDKNTEDIPF